MKKLILLLALMPSFALAQVVIPRSFMTVCSDTQSVVNVMVDKYGEKPGFIGVTKDEEIVSVWENKETGTFTIITTSVDGSISCILSTGDVPPKS
jgi:hypothetical protein